MASSRALADLQNAAVLWSIGSATVAEVVDAACLCLVAGVDTPVLRILAGVSPTETEGELLRWLEPAFDELGLIFYPKDSRAGQEAALRAMAHRAVAAAATPRELARWAHSTIGHDALPLAGS